MRGVDQLRISSEVSKMVPDIQEECKAKPEEEVKMEEVEEEDDEIAKARLERLKSLFELPSDGGIFAILLQRCNEIRSRGVQSPNIRGDGSFPEKYG